MSEARFQFAAKNYFADSTEELAQVRAPTLAIFGADDLNVELNEKLKSIKKN